MPTSSTMAAMPHFTSFAGATRFFTLGVAGGEVVWSFISVAPEVACPAYGVSAPMAQSEERATTTEERIFARCPMKTRYKIFTSAATVLVLGAGVLGFAISRDAPCGPAAESS